MNKSKLRAGLAMTMAAVCAASFALAAPELKESVKNGKVVRREWLEEDGSLVMGPEGYAYSTRTYEGATMTEKFFDIDGKPAMTAGGYYGRMLSYGARHRLEEVVYLNAAGKKSNSAAGYARLRMTYTSKGGITSAVYYDENGKWTVVPALGYAGINAEFRGSALTKREYLGANRKLTDTPLGYAAVIQKVNKKNQVLSIAYQHADGSAALGPEGWSTAKRTLDQSGREISVKYYDLDEKLMDLGRGFAYEVREWSSDLSCTVKRFDAEDNQIPMGNGYAAVRMDYNRDGQLIQETWLDTSGSATESLEGFVSAAYSFDGDGRLKKVTYADASGRTVLNRAGFAGYEETVDADGFVLSRVYLGTDGKPVNTAEGYSEIRWLYGETRQVLQKEYYDVNGSLIKQEEGA